jgi:hypothetical protein
MSFILAVTITAFEDRIMVQAVIKGSGLPRIVVSDGSSAWCYLETH